MFVSSIRARGNEARRLYTAMEDNLKIPSMDFHSLEVMSSSKADYQPTPDGVEVFSDNWTVAFELHGSEETCEVQFIYASNSVVRNILSRLQGSEDVVVEDVNYRTYSPENALRKLVFMRQRRGVMSYTR